MSRERSRSRSRLRVPLNEDSTSGSSTAELSASESDELGALTPHRQSRRDWSPGARRLATYTQNNTPTRIIIEWVTTLQPALPSANPGLLGGKTLLALLPNVPASYCISNSHARIRLFVHQDATNLHFGYIGRGLGRINADEEQADFSFIKIWAYTGNSPVCPSPVFTLPAAGDEAVRKYEKFKHHIIHELAPVTLYAVLSTSQNDPLFLADPGTFRGELRRLEASVVKVTSVSRPESRFDAYTQKQPNDVVFIFPDPHHKLPALQIWCNQSVLASSCEYFKDMKRFEDTTSEEETYVDLSNQIPIPNSHAVENRSDCESDSEAEQDNTARERQKGNNTRSKRLLTVEITAHSYTVYKSLLRYLYDGQPILFNTMRSAQPANFVNPNPPRPSPKSMYRLVHEMNIPELKELALEAYLSQITADNLATEIYGSFAATYDEVRSSLLKYALENGSALHPKNKQPPQRVQ